MKNKFTTLAKEIVYKGFFKMFKYTISHSLYAGGESKAYTREVLERGHAVAVLLHDPNRDEIVLVEQFRIGAIESSNPWLIELVAGIVEPGETPEDVARREALEECGAKVDELMLIDEFYNSAGGSTETTTLYYARIDATNVSGIHGLEYENEDIQVVKYTSEAFLSHLDNKAFRSASLLIAAYWFSANI